MSRSLPSLNAAGAINHLPILCGPQTGGKSRGVDGFGVDLSNRHSDAMIVVMAEQARSHFVTLSSSRGSITLPAEVRRRYRLDEPGAQVQVVERDDGVIELHPLLPHRADQAWFWTERWQQMEQEAQDDIAAGRVETFDDNDEFLADLEREAADRGPA